jgi:DDE superfamily endonuclease
VCNLFLVCEPLAGWRDVMVSDRRTRIDWAHCVKDLLDVHYPDAERVVLVQDDLNTHTPASLYEAFAPAEARRLADRLELHYTPKHGSWLSMAEIELSVLSQQCLDRRLADQATLEREVAAWQAARNACGRGVDWRFTTRMLGSNLSSGRRTGDRFLQLPTPGCRQCPRRTPAVRTPGDIEVPHGGNGHPWLRLASIAGRARRPVGRPATACRIPLRGAAVSRRQRRPDVRTHPPMPTRWPDSRPGLRGRNH